MPSYLSSALEGPVGIAAAAHAVQALRSRAGTRAWRTGLATGALFSGPWGGAPPRATDADRRRSPGLGVEIDEDALAARRLD